MAEGSELLLAIGRLNGVTDSLKETIKGHSIGTEKALRDIGERMRHVEIKVSTVPEISQDIDMMRKDIDELKADKNKFLGAKMVMQFIIGIFGAAFF